MTTKRRNSESKTVRARVEPTLKNRLNNFRLKPSVRRSEGFIVREALEDYLNRHEIKPA